MTEYTLAVRPSLVTVLSKIVLRLFDRMAAITNLVSKREAPSELVALNRDSSAAAFCLMAAK